MIEKVFLVKGYNDSVVVGIYLNEADAKEHCKCEDHSINPEVQEYGVRHYFDKEEFIHNSCGDISL